MRRQASMSSHVMTQADDAPAIGDKMCGNYRVDTKTQALAQRVWRDIVPNLQYRLEKGRWPHHQGRASDEREG